MEHFVAHPKGAFYGLPQTPHRYQKKLTGAKTHIKNLYLAGTDAYSLGILGAAMGGLAAAALVNRPTGFMKVMRHINKYAKKKRSY